MASRTPMVCAVLAAAAWLSHSALASQHKLCLERDAIGQSLANAHDEWPSATGLASNGELLEIYASPRGTWTLVLTGPDGTSCAVASGMGRKQDKKTETDDAES